MCYICHGSPHLSGCPHEDTTSFDKCTVCGGAIYMGQKIYDLNNEYIHYSCLRDLSGEEVLEILKISPKRVY